MNEADKVFSTSLFPQPADFDLDSLVVLLFFLPLLRFCRLAFVFQQEQAQEEDEETEIENWSSTHSVKTTAYLQPESAEEVRCTLRWLFLGPRGE